MSSNHEQSEGDAYEEDEFSTPTPKTEPVDGAMTSASSYYGQQPSTDYAQQPAGEYYQPQTDYYQHAQSNAQYDEQYQRGDYMYQHSLAEADSVPSAAYQGYFTQNSDPSVAAATQQQEPHPSHQHDYASTNYSPAASSYPFDSYGSTGSTSYSPASTAYNSDQSSHNIVFTDSQNGQQHDYTAQEYNTHGSSSSLNGGHHSSAPPMSMDSDLARDVLRNSASMGSQDFAALAAKTQQQHAARRRGLPPPKPAFSGSTFFGSRVKHPDWPQSATDTVTKQLSGKKKLPQLLEPKNSRHIFGGPTLDFSPSNDDLGRPVSSSSVRGSVSPDRGMLVAMTTPLANPVLHNPNLRHSPSAPTLSSSPPSASPTRKKQHPKPSLSVHSTSFMARPDPSIVIEDTIALKDQLWAVKRQNAANEKTIMQLKTEIAKLRSDGKKKDRDLSQVLTRKIASENPDSPVKPTLQLIKSERTLISGMVEKIAMMENQLAAAEVTNKALEKTNQDAQAKIITLQQSSHTFETEAKRLMDLLAKAKAHRDLSKFLQSSHNADVDSKDAHVEVEKTLIEFHQTENRNLVEQNKQLLAQVQRARRQETKWLQQESTYMKNLNDSRQLIQMTYVENESLRKELHQAHMALKSASGEIQVKDGRLAQQEQEIGTLTSQRNKLLKELTATTTQLNLKKEDYLKLATAYRLIGGKYGGANGLAVVSPQDGSDPPVDDSIVPIIDRSLSPSTSRTPVRSPASSSTHQRKKSTSPNRSVAPSSTHSPASKSIQSSMKTPSRPSTSTGSRNSTTAPTPTPTQAKSQPPTSPQPQTQSMRTNNDNTAASSPSPAQSKPNSASTHTAAPTVTPTPTNPSSRPESSQQQQQPSSQSKLASSAQVEKKEEPAVIAKPAAPASPVEADSQKPAFVNKPVIDTAAAASDDEYADDDDYADDTIADDEPVSSSPTNALESSPLTSPSSPSSTKSASAPIKVEIDTVATRPPTATVPKPLELSPRYPPPADSQLTTCDTCTSVAVWECEECESPFCDECFNDMHMTTKMKTHAKRKIGAADEKAPEKSAPQPVPSSTPPFAGAAASSAASQPSSISAAFSRRRLTSDRSVFRTPSGPIVDDSSRPLCPACLSAVATVICRDCQPSARTCSTCDQEIHEVTKTMRAHKREDINGSKSVESKESTSKESGDSSTPMLCEICENSNVAYRCMSCQEGEQNLCRECDSICHELPPHSSHQRIPVDTRRPSKARTPTPNHAQNQSSLSSMTKLLEDKQTKSNTKETSMPKDAQAHFEAKKLVRESPLEHTNPFHRPASALIPSTKLCTDCGDRIATQLCTTRCGELCADCNDQLHAIRTMRDHVVRPLSAASKSLSSSPSDLGEEVKLAPRSRPSSSRKSGTTAPAIAASPSPTRSTAAPLTIVSSDSESEAESDYDDDTIDENVEGQKPTTQTQPSAANPPAQSPPKAAQAQPAPSAPPTNDADDDDSYELEPLPELDPEPASSLLPSSTPSSSKKPHAPTVASPVVETAAPAKAQLGGNLSDESSSSEEDYSDDDF